MKLSSFKRLIEKDFPAEFNKLVGQLGLSINAAFDQVFNALNKQITFQDNINCTFSTFDVSIDSSGKVQKPVSFKLNDNQLTVSGILTINAVSKDDPNLYPVAGLAITFVKNDRMVEIKNIKGLVENRLYTVTVIAIA